MLAFRRKAMTNLDSIFKNRYIISPTWVSIVKTMVFLVVMHRCQKWIINKAEHWRIDAFELWCWQTLDSPLDSKEIKPVNLKRNQPWIFTGRTEAEVPILWPPDSLERTLKLGKIEGRRRKALQRMGWLDGIIDSMDMSLSKLWEIVKDRTVWRAVVHGVAKTWTRLSDWTTTKTNLLSNSRN